MKRLTILGSTGSIGRNVLRIVEQFPDRFSVAALAGGRNVDLLAEQVRRFSPEVAVVLDEVLARKLKERIRDTGAVEILSGVDAYERAATLDSGDLVVSAIVGSAGLIPTFRAIERGKPVALANKESLVMAGELLTKTAREKDVSIIPIDSEHSAIFQSLAGNRKEDATTIFLTASGGPFLEKPRETLAHMSAETALRHPTWDMGPKITIDSATLMNKGLEVIEARWLFDVPLENIRVIIHPESVIHSMVAYKDGSVLAQLGVPDMRVPIAYALSYPERLSTGIDTPDFVGLGSLTFQDPDLRKFPCLALAIEACRAGGTFPVVLNAANEVAVHAFLEDQIQFGRIEKIVKSTMDEHEPVSHADLEDILWADKWARQRAGENI
jgi:1-deoxy-D-xylulose-5-phosphate reductoisomerase